MGTSASCDGSWRIATGARRGDPGRGRKNNVVMAVYCVLLIKLSRSVLPFSAKPSGARTGLIVWAVLFSGFFSVALIISQVRILFSG